MKSKKTKRPSRNPTPESINVPQQDTLFDEDSYGDELAPFFDEMFPAKVVEKIHGPFLKMIVQKYNIRSACDLACRSGQTLALLKKLGVKKLYGLDSSAELLKQAKKKLGKSATLDRQYLRDAPRSLEGQTFDLILCTKDSLPAVLDDEGLFDFFRRTRGLLSDGGVFIAEHMNYGKIWKHKERFQPVMDRSKKGGGHFFFYMNDFHQELLVRHLIRLERNKHEWYLRSIGLPVRPFQPNEIELFVKEGGFSKWGFLGSYAGKPYVEKESPYTILLALK